MSFLTRDFCTGFPPEEAADLEKFKYVLTLEICLIIPEPLDG